MKMDETKKEKIKKRIKAWWGTLTEKQKTELLYSAMCNADVATRYFAMNNIDKASKE